ncbi:MAG: DUF1631 family protein, partial [Burkholderiales bacterium]|nr:DUF1631 family protein [Burkholderiales bacterium]
MLARSRIGQFATQGQRAMAVAAGLFIIAAFPGLFFDSVIDKGWVASSLAILTTPAVPKGSPLVGYQRGLPQLKGCPSHNRTEDLRATAWRRTRAVRSKKMHSTERRRYPRWSTRQKATVRGSGMTLDGEIRDYCQAGLFLAFTQPARAGLMRALPPGSLVELDFSEQRAGGVLQHRVHGRVARVLPTGLGLQVATMPQAVLRALQAAAAGEVRAQAPASTGQEVDAQTRRALRQACSRRFKVFIGAVLEDFFDRAPVRLQEASNEEADLALRSRLGEAAWELSSRRAEITTCFVESIGEAIRNAGRAMQAEQAGDMPGELALVDDEQFEDWLSIATVAQRIEADLSLPLENLQRRYGALQGIEVERDSNPFGPEVICRAFQDALQG